QQRHRERRQQHDDDDDDEQLEERKSVPTSHAHHLYLFLYRRSSAVSDTPSGPIDHTLKAPPVTEYRIGWSQPSTNLPPSIHRGWSSVFGASSSRVAGRRPWVR